MSHKAQYDVFLSHNSADKDPVETIARRLREEARLEPFLDRWHLVPGEPWQEAMEKALDGSRSCAVFLGPEGLGTWENEEMRAALDIRTGRPDFRVIPVLLPGARLPERGRLPRFLARLTWVDFRPGLDDARAFHELVCGIQGIAPGPEGVAEGEAVCPFRGLQVFDEEHAPFFFGREALTQHLVEQLREDRFLAVIGPSGSGKSSLVRAGLVPQIRNSALPASDRWPVVLFKPGPHPLEILAARLVPHLNGDSDPLTARGSLLAALAQDERGLHGAVQVALASAPDSARLLLVVDQFEELFTLCHDEAARAGFVANLLYASAIAGGQAVAVVTMRADFFGKCAVYPELAARLAERDVLVGPMSEEELHRAVEAPAEAVGLHYEKGLVNTILDDLGKEPGALPLLQHTLLELWERRRGGWLTTDVYHEIGRVQGALAQRADEIYGGLTPDQQEATRRVLLRLTQPGEGTEDTRRRAPLAELLPAEGETANVEAAVQELANARLLITGEDEQGEEIVDVAHEALIRGWPRLQQWIDEDRAALRIHRRLTEAAQEWKRHGRDASYLYRGSRLAKVEQWTRTRTANLSTLEHNFIVASIAARRTELVAQRQRQALRVAVVGLSVLVGITLVAFLWMFITGTGLFEMPGEWTHSESLDTRVNVIAVEPQDTAIIYAGTEDGRVLTSLDRSLTWRTVLEIEEEVQSLAVSPDDHSVLYAGTRGGHLLHSIDSGTSWPEARKILDAEEINYLLVDPVEPEILYACDVGLSCYQSLNEGADWITISETSNVSAIAVAANGRGGTILYLGTRDGLLLRSTDRGETWQYDPEREALPYITGIAVDPEDTDLVYMGTLQGLYRLQMKERHFDVHPMVADLGTVAITVDPLAPHVVFASVLNGNIYLVQQQGNSFRDEIIATGRDFQESSLTSHLVAGDHDPYFLYAATDEGVFAWEPSRQQKNTWFGHK